MNETLAIPPARTSSFFLPMRFMPAANRRALMTLHGFCRAVDDAVDEAPTTDMAKANLELWRREVEVIFSAATPSNPAARAFQDVVRAYAIPKKPVLEMLDGFAVDAEARVVIADWQALSDYCYRVAGCVGILSLPIMGVHSDLSQQFAVTLGHALQLTNILRDLDEDIAHGRWYFPQSVLTMFGISPDSDYDPVLVNALAVQVADKAQSYFEQTESLILKSERKRLIPALLMRDAYFMLLRRMQRRGVYLHKTAKQKLTLWNKAVLVARGVRYLCAV